MAPFRWPDTLYDIALAREVAANRPQKPQDWDAIADTLSKDFSTEDKQVELKGRACKDRLHLLITKYRTEDAKSLKRSGTEEEYDELTQLLEDISAYMRDFDELKEKEKEKKKKKEADDKSKAEEMRRAAMEGMAKRKRQRERDCDSPVVSLGHSRTSSVSSVVELDDEEVAEDHPPPSKKGKESKKATDRLSKVSAVHVLEQKFERKAELKERELELKRMDLELQRRKLDQEDEARKQEQEEKKQRLELELEERRTMLQLLKKHL